MRRTHLLNTSERFLELTFRSRMRVLGLLERVLQPVFARFGISSAQWGVLLYLHAAGEQGLQGLRLIDLSHRLLTRPPTLGCVVDRLERAGLVRRHGSPYDMRAKQVALTAKGRELVERILVVHARQIDTVLKVLSPAEQAELHRLLGVLEQHLEGVWAEGAAAEIG